MSTVKETAANHKFYVSVIAKQQLVMGHRSELFAFFAFVQCYLYRSCGPETILGREAFANKTDECCKPCFKTHARCKGCAEMKNIGEQDWTPKEIDHHRFYKTPLICTECRGKVHTKRDAFFFECAACSKAQGRVLYSKKDLNNNQTKNKAGKPYTLVCLACKEREEELVERLDSIDARNCPRRPPCGSSEFRHKDRCTAKFKARLSSDDLEFMSLRRGHREKYPLADLAYYERLGVLKKRL